jgi:hypothetical protein
MAVSVGMLRTKRSGYVAVCHIASVFRCFRGGFRLRGNTPRPGAESTLDAPPVTAIHEGLDLDDGRMVEISVQGMLEAGLFHASDDNRASAGEKQQSLISVFRSLSTSQNTMPAPNIAVAHWNFPAFSIEKQAADRLCAKPEPAQRPSFDPMQIDEDCPFHSRA